jgi:hypothetical protein
MSSPYDLRIIDGISIYTKKFFTTKRRVKEFLDLISSCGSVALASSKWDLSPIEVQDLIDNDSALQKLVKRSLKLALELAEGVLYERAVNGYVEETLVDGVVTGEKKKFSDTCLMNYLKANSDKYNPPKAITTEAKEVVNKLNEGVSKGLDIEVPEFESPIQAQEEIDGEDDAVS